jgi:hypothetical protein
MIGGRKEERVLGSCVHVADSALSLECCTIQGGVEAFVFFTSRK